MKKLALALTLACLLAPAPTRAQNAYITNFNSNTVSVIDTTTDTVRATIPVSLAPDGVAVSSDGSKVYITHPGSNTVSVIDTATNTVTATISVGLPQISNSYAVAVAVSPDGGKVYVTNAVPNAVSVIDTAANAVSATIPLGPFAFPAGVAVSPDGSKIYVTVTTIFLFTSNVLVIDTATNTVSATVPVGSGAFGVAVKPDGSKVYVANASANTVSVIDTATNTVIAMIPVGSRPVAFGVFIQPALRFAGVPGSANCHGTSVSALATKFGGLDAAAAALGFSNVQGLQDAIRAFCEG
jgi:YVTN family beta-propeller protein